MISKEKIEEHYPLVLAIIIGIGVHLFFMNEAQYGYLLDKVIDNGLSISGVLLGFLLTIATVIGTINSKATSFLKEAGKYGTVKMYLHIAMTSCFIALCVFYFHPFVDLAISQDTLICEIYHGFIMIISAWFILTTLRLISIFMRLLS